MQSYWIYHSGSIAQSPGMPSTELPAGVVNMYSVTEDFIISMFYESPFFFSLLLQIILRDRELSSSPGRGTLSSFYKRKDGDRYG